MMISKRLLAAALLAASTGLPKPLTAADEPVTTVLEQPVTFTALVDDDGDDKDSAAAKRERREEKLREEKLPEAEQPKVWLGIGLKEIDGDLASYLGSSEGVLIESVFPDSPAQDAKLQEGDIVIAFEGKKVAGPTALIDALRKFGSAHSVKTEARVKGDKKQPSDEQADADKQEPKYPAVELKILRRGKEITVNMKPTVRPESVTSQAEEALAQQVTELESALKDLKTQGEAKILRFGPPVTLERRMFQGPQHHELRNFIIVLKDEDGKTTEVRFERVGHEPPKITLKEGDKSREIKQDELDQLPERLRKTIVDTLKKLDETKRQEQAAEDAARDARDAWRKAITAEAHKNIAKEREAMEEQRRRASEGPRVRIVGPEGAVDLGESAEELAAKVRALAEEMARRGVKNVQDFAAMPEQLRELRAQIEELKQDIGQLKAMLQDAPKK